jgi:hypothetical protein
MGERQSDGGLPGRRRVHPGGPASPAPRRVVDGAALEALLAATLRGDRIDAEAERRAVAAFRAARESGAHRARTRRRDDWRTREQRRARWSVKATLSVLLASLTLGGVAVAAIGVAGSSTDGAGSRRERPQPSAGAPGRSPGESPVSPSTSAGPDRPAPAQDTEAHCRAYEQVKAQGKVLDATAWQRLVAAAGGEEHVAAYCSRRLAQATAEAKPGKTGKPEKNADSGGSDNTGGSGGTGSAGTGGGAGSGSANGGAGSGQAPGAGQPNGSNP